MRSYATRLTRPVVATALAVTLAACTGSTTTASDVQPQVVQVSPVADIGPCPTLPRADPVEGGLPDLTLPCLGKGPDVRLSDLRGTATIVNVWAAWCSNCEREMPLFGAAMTSYGSQVRFLGIHYKAPPDAGMAAVRDFAVPFPSVQDTDGDRVVREVGAYAPPQTFFVDSDGRVAGHKIGEIRSQRELRDLVERYLGVTA